MLIYANLVYARGLVRGLGTTRNKHGGHVKLDSCLLVNNATLAYSFNFTNELCQINILNYQEIDIKAIYKQII